MFIILLFTISGFLVGFFYVMKKRRITPGSALSAAFMGFLSLAIVKMLREYFNRKRFYP